jgi:UDP-N-acetylglucosamine acyltransferase
MTRIHPSAIVDKGAEIGNDVEIGPFCVVERDVVIQPGVKLHPQVFVRSHTRIGEGTEVFSGTVLGGEPQSTGFRGEKSYLIIGRNNLIREFCTLHRATGEGNATRIGDNNMIMAYCHVAHDSQLGDNIVMASHSGMAGHAIIEDRVTFGALSGVHQYCRVGTLAMIGGYAKVVQDVPPYMMVDGQPARVVGPNTMGLRRASISPEARSAVKAVFRMVWRSDLNMTQAIERIEREVPEFEEVTRLVEAIKRMREGSLGRSAHEHE